MRKYSLDEHWLDSLDCEEKFYFLGFFAADGCNHGNYLEVKLKSDDRNILEKMAIWFNYNGPLYEYTQKIKDTDRIGHYVALSIHSSYLCNRLTELGLPPRKTFALRFPVYISDENMRHYIRGYFDGDGSITVRRTKTTLSPSAEFSGASAFLWDLNAIIYQKFGFSLNFRGIPRKGGENFQAKFGNTENTFVILDWIYANCTIFLDRKYSRYKELREYRDNHPENRAERAKRLTAQKDQIIQDRMNGMSCKNLAEKYNCSENYLFKLFNSNKVYVYKTKLNENKEDIHYAISCRNC